MESIRQTRRRLQAPHFGIRLQLPSYLHLIAGLLLGLAVIVTTAVKLTRLMPPASNPFAAYTTMLAAEELEAEFWTNYESLYHVAFALACKTSPAERFCYYQPPSGPFEYIKFKDLNDEGASGIYFAVHDSALTVGDFALLWGRPNIARAGGRLTLHWPDQHMNTVVDTARGQFDYWLPVSYLILEGHP